MSIKNTKQANSKTTKLLLLLLSLLWRVIRGDAIVFSLFGENDEKFFINLSLLSLFVLRVVWSVKMIKLLRP